MELKQLGREKLEHYFLEELPEKLSAEAAYPLLLLVLGERPGALVMSAGREKRKLLKQFADDFGLEYRTYGEDEKSLIDRLLRRETPLSKPGVFLTRDAERFDIVEKSDGRFYGTSDEAVGRFLGYPDSAIEYYDQDGTIGSETVEKISHMIDQGEISQEKRRYLDLTTYIPEPSKDAIREAIAIGEKREKLLHELDQALDTDIGERYLNARMSIRSY